MYEYLYFLMPKFRRWKVEQKIVNVLKAQCYRVVDKYTKHFYGEDDLWIVMEKDIIMVKTPKNRVNEINNLFYKKRG